MATLEEVSVVDEIDQDILNSSTDDIVNRTRLLENEIKVHSRQLLRLTKKIMKSETQRLTHEQGHMTEKIKDNTDKIENNRQLPYLVGTYPPSEAPSNLRQRHRNPRHEHRRRCRRGRCKR